MKIKKETLITLLVAFCIFLAVSLTLCFISFNNDNSLGRLLGEIDLRYGDERFEYRNQKNNSPTPPPEVVILAIDERSVNELGRWPWSRSVFADFVNKLSEYEPKVVAFDIVNSEYTNEKDDAALGAALKNLKNPILGYFFRDTESTEHNEKAFKQIKKSKINIVKVIEEPHENYSRNYKLYKSVELNVPEIGKSSKGFGFFNFQPDSDGIFRRAILTTKYEGGFYPSLSLEAFRKYIRGQVILSLDRFGIKNLYVNKNEIPVSERGQLILNFYGETGTIPTYSIVDVLNGELDAEKIKNKIVLVGATEIAIYDIRPSPLDNIFPGIELQATAVANILSGNYLLKNSFTATVDLVLIIAFSFFLILFLFFVKRTITGVLILIIMIFIHIYSNYYIFENYNLLLSGTFPILSLVLSFVFYEGYRNLIVEKKSRFLKRAFSSYVSPDLVTQIISNPDKLNLGGESRNITLLFSDIRGFTSLSESTTPTQLVEILNEYLSPMTTIVMQNKGTLDKFIGDAVMAIYGAPFDLPTHGKNACDTAIMMFEKLEELNKSFKERELPRIDIGLGINTGEAVVGNMGADVRFDYTAIGDSVNLAARLEGQTKYYGVGIIISKSTLDEIDPQIINNMDNEESFLIRELDYIKVKGKTEPILIYQLIPENGSREKIMRLINKFDEGLEYYRKREFELAKDKFSQILEDNPLDGPSKLYIERCEEYFASPPPEDWDLVYTATSK